MFHQLRMRLIPNYNKPKAIFTVYKKQEDTNLNQIKHSLFIINSEMIKMEEA